MPSPFKVAKGLLTSHGCRHDRHVSHEKPPQPLECCFLSELKNIKDVWLDGDSKILSDFLFLSEMIIPVKARHHQFALIRRYYRDKQRPLITKAEMR